MTRQRVAKSLQRASRGIQRAWDGLITLGLIVITIPLVLWAIYKDDKDDFNNWEKGGL